MIVCIRFFPAGGKYESRGGKRGTYLKKSPRGPSIAVMLHRTLAGALLVLATTLLAACGARAVGYGVVLWGDPNGSPQTGTVVPIVREAPIDSAYLLKVPGEQSPREFPMGRVRLFRKKTDADAFAHAYADNLANSILNSLFCLWSSFSSTTMPRLRSSIAWKRRPSNFPAATEETWTGSLDETTENNPSSIF